MKQLRLSRLVALFVLILGLFVFAQGAGAVDFRYDDKDPKVLKVYAMNPGALAAYVSSIQTAGNDIATLEFIQKDQYARMTLSDTDYTAIRGLENLTTLNLAWVRASNDDGSFTQFFAGAFQNMKSLTSVTLPEDLAAVGANAFSGCENLKTVENLSAARVIYDEAFKDCTSLKSVTVGANAAIGDSAFTNSGLETVTLGNGATIGYGAFSSCARLVSIDLSGVASIGNNAFKGCENLSDVTWWKGEREVGAQAFHGCALDFTNGYPGLHLGDPDPTTPFHNQIPDLYFTLPRGKSETVTVGADIAEPWLIATKDGTTLDTLKNKRPVWVDSTAPYSYVSSDIELQGDGVWHNYSTWADTPRAPGVYQYSFAIHKSGSGTLPFSVAPLSLDYTLTISNPPRHPVTALAVAPDSLALTVGDAESLVATVTPANYSTANRIAWSSDNEQVATVDEGGKVTAVKRGKATVTATLVDSVSGQTFTATASVTVETPEEIGVGIEVLAVRKGKTLVLPIFKGYVGEWAVADGGVARLTKNGKRVKALAIGETTLTYTVKEAPSAKKALVLNDRKMGVGDTYTIKLNVRKAGELASRLTLDKKKLTLSTVDQPEAQLIATVGPGKARDQEVFWTSSNPSVATVDKHGTVIARSPGKAKITAVATSLKRKTITVTVEGAIALKPSKKSLRPGKTLSLTATVASGLADKSVAYTSSDPAVAIVDESGLVTAIKKGKAKITATASNGETATCTITVKK